MRILGRLRGLLFRGRVRVRGEDDPPPGHRCSLVDVYSVSLNITVDKCSPYLLTGHHCVFPQPILSVHIMITTFFPFRSYTAIRSMDMVMYCCWYGGLTGGLLRGRIQRATLFALAMDITYCPMSDHATRHAHVELDLIIWIRMARARKPCSNCLLHSIRGDEIS